jgi:hypothetical protein
MARLAGFIANRPDVGARMLAREGASLVARPREGITPGWGSASTTRATCC